jgi:16S rRNA (cytosine967-C5)-methyltransferase
VDECAITATDELEAHDEPGHAVFTGTHDALVSVLDRLPSVRVQDPSAAAAVGATAPLQPRCIIDYCAGVGTKTRQLAALHHDAEIIATDVNERRFETLRATFANHPRVCVVEHSSIMSCAGRADLLVLDVPCSNTGVLARRFEAKYRFSATSLNDLTQVQRQIIADALPLLADDGRLLYSTCSLEAEENERQAEWIIKWHRLRTASASRRRPSGEPGGPPRHYQDGGYFALLEHGSD